MALVGTCPSDTDSKLKMLAKLERCREWPSIPFVIDKGEGSADYGYASHQWVIDLYRIFAGANSPASERERGCIVGLLLGYSPDAINRGIEMYDLIVSRTDQRPTNIAVCPTGGKGVTLA